MRNLYRRVLVLVVPAQIAQIAAQTCARRPRATTESALVRIAWRTKVLANSIVSAALASFAVKPIQTSDAAYHPLHI